MAKKIKKILVFLFLSLFFSLLSGKVERRGVLKTNRGWNSAAAGFCCTTGVGTSIGGGRCCCGGYDCSC